MSLAVKRHWNPDDTHHTFGCPCALCNPSLSLGAPPISTPPLGPLVASDLLSISRDQFPFRECYVESNTGCSCLTSVTQQVVLRRTRVVQMGSLLILAAGHPSLHLLHSYPQHSFSLLVADIWKMQGKVILLVSPPTSCASRGEKRGDGERCRSPE